MLNVSSAKSREGGWGWMQFGMPGSEAVKGDYWVLREKLSFQIKQSCCRQG